MRYTDRLLSTRWWCKQCDVRGSVIADLQPLCWMCLKTGVVLTHQTFQRIYEDGKTWPWRKDLLKEMVIDI